MLRCVLEVASRCVPRARGDEVFASRVYPVEAMCSPCRGDEA